MTTLPAAGIGTGNAPPAVSDDDAFNHVLDIVLRRDDSTPLKQALVAAGFTDIPSLVSLSDDQIDDLKDNKKKLAPSDYNLVKLFIMFRKYRRLLGTPLISNDDYAAVLRADYDRFRVDEIDDYLKLIATANTPAPTVITPGTNVLNAPVAVVKNPLELFKRGIKRDQSVYPELKKEELNDTWHSSFETQAHAQDVANVLDPSYTPVGQDLVDLFQAQNTFMYAVLEAKVHTDRGKAILREHAADRDAQKAYEKIKNHHTSSTKAKMSSSDLLTYITSAKLGSGAWRGSTEGFVTHWQNQVRLYERLCEANERFSDGQKTTMLQNAVQPLEMLASVKQTAELDRTKTGRALTYDQYCSLLISAAVVYDQSSNRRVREDPRVAQAANLMEVFDRDDRLFAYVSSQLNDYRQEYNDLTYDDSTPASLLLANAAQQRGQRPFMGRQDRVFMPKQRWSQLSPEARTQWDGLSNKDKAIILGQSDDAVPVHQRPPDQRTVQQRVNLSEMSAIDLLQAYLHDMDGSEIDDNHIVSETTTEPSEITPGNPDDGDSLLINAMISGNRLRPGDIRRVLSSSKSGKKSSTREVKTHMVYRAGVSKVDTVNRSLVDRGANGGVAGVDVRIIHRTSRKVDIVGIDNHTLNDIYIGTAGGVVETDQGPVILVLNQYALLSKGRTIHSPGQLEWYGNDVNDKSSKIGGLQRIKTHDGYIIPLSLDRGLPGMRIRPFTDDEFESYPHVILTNELPWDPSVLDFDPHDQPGWFETIDSVERDPTSNLFDEFGEYRHRVTVQCSASFGRADTESVEDVIDRCIYNVHHVQLRGQYKIAEAQTIDDDYDEPIANSLIKPRLSTTRDPDFAALRPMFAWLDPKTVEHTLQHTTQLARLPMGTMMKRAFKSQNPALNVVRRSEPVACDIVYSDTPAIDDGSVAAVLFVGLQSKVTDCYGIKADRQFINTLEDNIRERGAPTKLISDRAQVEISEKVKSILRTLFIGEWQSEPHQQQQNPAERRYQTIKNRTNVVLDRSGAPEYTWLLALQYVCFVLNHCYDSGIGSIPLSLQTGITIDTSIMLRFHFYQKVYYQLNETEFPSGSKEGLGYMVGFHEHVGSALCYKVLTADTLCVIPRSQLRPCTDDDKNLRVDPPDGEENQDDKPVKPVVQSAFEMAPELVQEDNTEETSPDASPAVEPLPGTSPDRPVFNPEDLIGKTFLLDPNEDGTVDRARIVELLEDLESKLDDNPTRIKFKIAVGKDKLEDMITYAKLMDYLQRDEESPPIYWKFKRIISHQKVARNHPDYNGSQINVMVEWENGEITSEPLKIIAESDPVTCAVYAKDNNLLNEPGWKQFKSMGRKDGKFLRLVNKAKIESYKQSTKYKYGYEIPKSYEHAMELDRKAGNTKWRDAFDTEIAQVDEYDTFEDIGERSSAKVPKGYKRIRVHIVFDVKHDGRHKVRLVADGHLTEIPLESVYSGVVSLRGFRLVVFVAELNGLQMWATDVGNAYLEAFTLEKVYIVAGPEFGERRGHILIIRKALYGLRTSGKRWYERLAACLREMGFVPCKAEPDVWLRSNGKTYEYVAVYVDDLGLAVVKPVEFLKVLTDKYKFKLKGSGPIAFHLGMDFSRDEDGVLCMAPTKYLDKVFANYERMFGEKPKQNVSTPLEGGDHPELDMSDFLDDDGITQYQSLIGTLQWVISIGRFDITTHVMSLSSYRIAPRIGHLDRAKRIVGYLAKMKHACIRFRIDTPDYSDLPIPVYDWSSSVYNNPKEVLPTDAPKPLGKTVVTTHYCDASLFHDMLTGKAVTATLHFVNQTPCDWFSKKQATVETATYGSEFVAARTCVEQIIDIRNTLRYMGIPVEDRCYMFGDNESVVNSATTPHGKLHKRHIMLSYHRVREAIASGMIVFTFIPGWLNPADILSKHWSYKDVWQSLKAILFWKGDTVEIKENGG